MKIRQFIAFFLVLVFLVPLSLIQSPNVKARDWGLQISDPKDSRNKLDFKSIYARDDNEYLYFKVESYGTWDLEDNMGGLAIVISTDGKAEPDLDYVWMMMVMESDGVYEGMVIDMSFETMEMFEVDFKKGSSIGTMKISKELIKLKTIKFSMAGMIVSVEDNRDSEPLDVAPDNFKFVTYKPSDGGKGPKLGLSTKTLSLGSIPSDSQASGNFDVLNDGDGTLTASLKTSPVLSLSRDELEISDYASETIIVNVDAKDLSPKTYNEKIEIQSKYGNESVLVNFEVLPKPVLEVDLKTIDFGTIIKGERKTEKIRISNQRKGPIKGSLSTSEKWILLSKSSFTIESGYEEITISVSSKNLDPGPISGEISISSNGGKETILLSGSIIESLSIDTTLFDFGEINWDDPRFEPITCILQNQTDRDLNLKIKPSDPFILVDKEIVIQANDTDSLVINLDIKKMEINKPYESNILFESKYSKIEVPLKVILKQDPPKILWLTEPADQQNMEEKLITGKTWEKFLKIKNDGSGTLDVSVKWEQDKTEFLLFTGSFSLKKGETADIKIKLDSTSMKLGTYKNTLLITSNGGNLSIPISIEVVPKPEIVIKLYVGLTLAYIDEKPITLEASPFINHGSTMVPLRFIADAFKAKTDWIPMGKGRILLSTLSKAIQLDIGSKTAYINGIKISLQAPPEIKSGRTFVPLRFIAEGLGARIEWKAQTQQITIFYVVED